MSPAYTGAACTNPTPPTAPTLVGVGEGNLAQGAACPGSGGYSDIDPGQEIMLRTAA